MCLQRQWAAWGALVQDGRLLWLSAGAAGLLSLLSLHVVSHQGSSQGSSILRRCQQKLQVPVGKCYTILRDLLVKVFHPAIPDLGELEGDFMATFNLSLQADVSTQGPGEKTKSRAS